MENFKTKILKHNNKILNNLNLKIERLIIRTSTKGAAIEMPQKTDLKRFAADIILIYFLKVIYLSISNKVKN